MTVSRFFGSRAPVKPHLLQASGGIAAEVLDLRSDVEAAFLLAQTEAAKTTVALPTSPFTGQICWDTTATALKVWDGAAWQAALNAGGIASADLASTANAKGASLVGIEDAAALYTGANVEAALAEKLTGLRIANVADDAVVGGIEVVHVIDIANGVTADKDVVLTHKTEILSVEVVKKAGAGGVGDTITVKNGATAITDAMSINVADKVVVRAATIDDAQTVIAAAGTLRVAMVNGAAGGNNTACRVIVRGIRRA